MHTDCIDITGIPFLTLPESIHYFKWIMKIILIRHGEAENAADDFNRHLTEKGKNDIKKISTLLNKTGWNFTGIYSSPVIRTKETASILQAQIHAKKQIIFQEKKELSPGLQPEHLNDLISETEGSNAALWVFHMPDVARIASWFTGMPESGFYISPGTAVALNVPPSAPKSRSVIIFTMPPEYL